MARHAVHLHTAAHVPQAAGAVAAASHEQRQLRVQRNGKDARQVAVIMPDHLHILMSLADLMLQSEHCDSGACTAALTDSD